MSGPDPSAGALDDAQPRDSADSDAAALRAPGEADTVEEQKGAQNPDAAEFDAESTAGTRGEHVLEEPGTGVAELFGLSFPAVQEFARMLAEEGELRGLIGPRELPRLWSRHIVNSAAVLDFLPRKGQVLDVGSGAGFPGVIIAIARPDLDVHLAEPMQRRCEWLADVVAALDLDNVTIHQARAEELRGKGKADVVTARAVANMSKLIRLTSKLIAPHGRLVALKGRRAPLEVEEAAAELKRHHLGAQVHEVPSIMEDDSTYVVVCHRV